jgi:hypothetical protein
VTSDRWQLPDPPDGKKSVDIGPEDVEETTADPVVDEVADSVATQKRVEPPD